MTEAMQRLADDEVCTLPAGCLASAVTNDGHVIATFMDADGKVRFCWDGVCGKPFDRLVELRDKSPAIFASGDGNHLAYVGVRGDSVFVGRDDREDPECQDFSRSVPPVFDREGKHLAYGARLPGGEFRLILDGEPTASTEIAPMEATFSLDGERLAYVEMRGERRGDMEYRIVLDGLPGHWFAGMRNAPGAMQFSPDGQRFAHYTIDGKGGARWFVDGRAHRQINDTRPLSVASIRGVGVVDPPLPARFSPDGSRFAYFADVVEKGVAIVEDDVPGPLFNAVGVPVFSADSRRLAYSAQTFAKGAALVLDGDVLGEWPATTSGQPVFSSDGRRIAMALGQKEGSFLRKHSTWSIVIDGRLFGSEPGADAGMIPTFSPDGRQIASWVQRETGTVVPTVDGAALGVPWSVESDIRFDPTGRMVYVARVGGSRMIVVGEEPGPAADEIVSLRTLDEAWGRDPWMAPPSPFRISPAGNVASVGLSGGRFCPILDNEIGPAFDAIVACRVDATAASWWAQRDHVVYRVTRPLDSAQVIPETAHLP